MRKKKGERESPTEAREAQTLLYRTQRKKKDKNGLMGALLLRFEDEILITLNAQPFMKKL